MSHIFLGNSFERLVHEAVRQNPSKKRWGFLFWEGSGSGALLNEYVLNPIDPKSTEPSDHATNGPKKRNLWNVVERYHFMYKMYRADKTMLSGIYGILGFCNV